MGEANAIVVSDNYAYVTDGQNGLVIVDISDPSIPYLVGNYDTIEDARGIAVSGNYAFVVDLENGLVIVDISDPSMPYLVGNYNTVGYASYGIAILDNYAYVADGNNGLVILRNDTSSTNPVHNINKGTNYSTIQAAINDANPGDEIHVDSGIYIENVNVNKQLTLKGEGADVVTVRSAYALDPVFEITADYVNISEFTVEQVHSPSGYSSGIVLSEVNDCKISENKIGYGSSHGIPLFNSKNNIIENNTVRHVATGVSLRGSSNYNIIRNNIIEMNNYGIYLYNLQYDMGPIGNTITCNDIMNNYYCGIKLKQSNSNTIYLNDFINNADNACSEYSINIWNSTSQITYIYDANIHTNYLGNYWDNYTDIDADNDGIWDTRYPIDSNNDYHPLIEPFENYSILEEDWKNEWMSEDSDGGTAVTTIELQDAIHHWLEDIRVRGYLMSTVDLQEIIVAWLSG